VLKKETRCIKNQGVESFYIFRSE